MNDGDLISRKALTKRMAFYKSEFEPGEDFDSAVLMINNAPAVDAVEVVRCRECKHWDCYGGEDAHKGDCTELVGLESCMYEEDFCSYGERRDK